MDCGVTPNSCTSSSTDTCPDSRTRSSICCCLGLFTIVQCFVWLKPFINENQNEPQIFVQSVYIGRLGTGAPGISGMVRNVQPGIH